MTGKGTAAAASWVTTEEYNACAVGGEGCWGQEEDVESRSRGELRRAAGPGLLLKKAAYVSNMSNWNTHIN